MRDDQVQQRRPGQRLPTDEIRLLEQTDADDLSSRAAPMSEDPRQSP
ncbi:hypothetical protein [Streptomyces sp. NPDC058371]